MVITLTKLSNVATCSLILCVSCCDQYNGLAGKFGLNMKKVKNLEYYRITGLDSSKDSPPLRKRWEFPL